MRVFVLLVLAGCGRQFSQLTPRDTSALSNLTYAFPESVLAGVALEPIAPQITGEAKLFQVSPPLPDGLVLSPTDGSISGTPEEAKVRAEYTVSASNDASVTTAVIAFAVTDVAPLDFHYTPALLVANRGIQATELAPSWTRGKPTHFSVTPALPPGLSIHQTLGLIAGTPLSTALPAIYTVHAENDFGGADADVSITVFDAPPFLSYPDEPYYFVAGTNRVSARPINSGGKVESCTASTSLPPGLALQDDCSITGVPDDVAFPLTEMVLEAHYSNGSSEFRVVIGVVQQVKLSPPSVSVDANHPAPIVFSAVGGVPPFFFSGEGVEINATTGALADITRTGSGVVTVRDAFGFEASAPVVTRRQWVENTYDPTIVHAVAVDESSIYVGGDFRSAGPHFAPGMAVLRSDDLHFDEQVDLGTGFNGTVRCVVSDGAFMYAGGDFFTYRGQTARHLAKIDLSTGTLDTTFVADFDGPVDGITFAGEALIVNGQFAYQGVFEAARIAKIDRITGALDTSFNLQGVTAYSPTSNITQTVVFGDYVYVMLDTTSGSYREQHVDRISRLSLSDGALLPFDSSAVNGLFQKRMAVNDDGLWVLAAALDPRLRRLPLPAGGAAFVPLDQPPSSGSIDIIGHSLYVTSTTITERSTADGTVQRQLTLPSGMSVDNAVFTNEQLIVTAGQTVAAFDLATSTQQGLVTTATHGLMIAADAAHVFAFAPGMVSFGGLPRTTLASFDTNTGRPKASFNAQLTGTVRALAVSPTALYVGGNLFAAGTGDVNGGLVKLDPDTGARLPFAELPAGTVYEIARRGSELWVVGGFTTYRPPSGPDVPANNLVVLNADTGALIKQPAFSLGSWVTTMAFASDAVYLGGNFVANATMRNFAKTSYDFVLDGSVDARFAEEVTSLLPGPPGTQSKILVGGLLTEITRPGGPEAVTGVVCIDVYTGTTEPTHCGAFARLRDPLGIQGTREMVKSSDALFVGSASMNKALRAFRPLGIDDSYEDTALTNAMRFTNGPSSPSIVSALYLLGSRLFVGGVFTTYQEKPAPGFVVIDSVTGAPAY